MRTANSTLIGAVMVTGAFIASPLATQDGVRPLSAGPAALPAWMAGCWAGTGQTDSREYWFAAGSDALVGLARSVRSGRLAGYEFMVIRATPAGLSFTAKPSGQAEATFIATRTADREVVFENAAHDFPQRVIYRSDTNEALTGRVEGTENGKQRAIEYPMRRTTCQ